MKPYEELTNRGKARRLRQLAIHALEQYDLDVADIRLVGVFTNTLFRVRTDQGPAYILRVCRPGWRTAEDLRAEVMWLQALSGEAEISAPQPRLARNGDLLVEASAEGVPEPRRCVLMSWVPGTLLGHRLTEENLYKMGVLFARLHEHTASFAPPQGFSQRRMNHIYARDEEDVLFEDGCRDDFTPQTRDIFERTLAKVNEAFEHLYADPAGLQVIHNDLHHNNIKVYRGRLYPFDFEDTIWGYPVQDIAMALQDLMVDVSREAFDPLQNAFRQGYESRRKWPEDYPGQIDTFRAGRIIWVANYVARYEREYLGGFVERLAKIFAKFLETGKIRKLA